MKCHIYVANDPIKEGEDLTALCGSTVPKARFEFWFDAEGRAAAEIMMNLSSISTCGACLRTETKGRYFYGVIPGQEARDFEAA
jgi:hypothetical protein